MRPCDAGDVSTILRLHSRRPPEPIFRFFLFRCKKTPTLFLCRGWGGRRKIGTIFLRFCGFECQKRGKNRGSDVALRAKKSAFFGSQRGPKIRRLGGVLTVNFVFLGVKRRLFWRRRRPKNGVMRHFFGWKLLRRFGRNSGRRTRRKGISLSGKGFSARGKERRIVALSHCRTTSPACARFIIYMEI